MRNGTKSAVLCFIAALILLFGALVAYAQVPATTGEKSDPTTKTASSEKTNDVIITGNVETEDAYADSSLCAMPRQRFGNEDDQNMQIIMPPSCVIANDRAGLTYLRSYNLSRVPDKFGKPVATDGVKAIYTSGNGRCAVLFIKYPSEEAIRKELVAQSDSPIRNLGSGNFYTDEQSSFAVWHKNNYLISVAPDIDYSNWKRFNVPCDALIKPYVEKIGSDLMPFVRVSNTVSAQNTCSEDGTGDKCMQTTVERGTGNVPDEDGMVTECDLNEVGVVICKKVKASGLAKAVQEENAGVIPVEAKTTGIVAGTEQSKEIIKQSIEKQQPKRETQVKQPFLAKVRNFFRRLF